MVKHFFFKTAPGIAAAALFLALPLSCVNEEFDLEKIDTTVQFGGDALVFPLGSTTQLKLKTLLSEEDFEYITTLDGGVYGFTMNDQMNLSDEIPDLGSELNIDPVSIKEDIEMDISGVNTADLKVEAQNFTNDISFDGISIPELDIQDEHFTNTVASGIYEYAPDPAQLDMSDDFGQKDFSFGGLLDPSQAFSSLFQGEAGDNVVSIPDNMIPGISPFNKSTGITVHLELPDGLSDIKDIKLDPDAQMVISMSLENSFLISGSVTPAIRLNHTDLVVLENVSGALSLDSDFELNAGNGYSVSKSYPIESLVISDSDWSQGANGLELNKSADIATLGTVSLSGISSSLNKINESSAAGGLGVLVSVSFENVVIDDMTVTVEDIDDDIAPEPFEIEIDPVELPEHVTGVTQVNLSENSGIDIEINPTNFSGLGAGFTTSVTDLVIQFPEEIVAEGLNPQNQFVISDVDLTQSTSQHINVTAIKPGSAENGVINIDGQITVTAAMKAGGTLNLSNLPSSESKDPALEFIVDTRLEVDDFILTMEEIEHTIDKQEQPFSIDLPDGIGELGVMTIDPEGAPKLTVDIDIPQLTDMDVMSRNLKISFPSMLVFENVKPEYGYSQEDNSVNFVDTDIPDQIVMDIASIVVTPKKDENSGKPVAEGIITFDGIAYITPKNEEGVSSHDIQSLIDGGIKITANIPEMTAQTVSFDRFETSIEQEETVELINLDNLPEELESLKMQDVILKDTQMELSMTATNIPDMGAGKIPQISLEVYLPSELVLDDDRVDENNVLRVSGPLADDGFKMEPLDISRLDLRGVDFSEGGVVSRTIKVLGKVYVDDPDIDPEDLNNQTIYVTIDGGIPAVNIEKVTGYVDYQLGASGEGQNLNQSISLEELPEFVKGEDFTLDFTRPYIELEVNSNIGIPVNGTLQIVPVYNGAPDTQLTQTIDLNIPKVGSSSEAQTINYWIAGNAEGMPAGYTHLQANIAELLKKIPDSIELNVTAGTDPEEISVIEPNADYKLELSYDVVVPFEFGKDLGISMDYTFPGDQDEENPDGGASEDGLLPPILGELLNMNSLGLGGQIESTLPLRLELNVELLDSKGGVIKTEPVEMVIAEGSAEKPSVSPIDIMLHLAEGSDAADLSKIRLAFSVTSGSMTGEPVTEESYIKAVLKVKVPGGVTIDLSSLGESENNTENTGSEN